MHLRELQQPQTLRLGQPYHTKWMIYTAFALFPLLAASSEKVSEATNTTQNLGMRGIRRLLIDPPCLPCFRKEEMGCRRKFGCVVNSDGTVSSALLTSVISRDPVKNTAGAQGATRREESPCLPCYSYDWHGRCRRIRGCVSSTAPPPAPTTLIPATEATGDLTPESGESGVSTLPEDTGSSGSSDPHQEPTDVTVTSSDRTTLFPLVETSIEYPSVPLWSSEVPSVWTFEPTPTMPQENES